MKVAAFDVGGKMLVQLHSKTPTTRLAAKLMMYILTAHLATQSDRSDVIVGRTLFGKILSDLGPRVAGGISTAATASLYVERRYPSMFEPVHGSPPDIAGKGIVNPIAAIWTAALLLDHLGAAEGRRAVMTASRPSLVRGPSLARPWGNAKINKVSNALMNAIV